MKVSSVLLSFVRLKNRSDSNLWDLLDTDVPVKARDHILESGELSHAPKRSVINAHRVCRDVAQILEGKDIEVHYEIRVVE